MKFNLQYEEHYPEIENQQFEEFTRHIKSYKTYLKHFPIYLIFAGTYESA
jgi:hypothetical protein